MGVQRNIEINPETWKKLKNEATKRNKNVRDFAGEVLDDYLKGATQCKPGTKAIIIAAGMSSRLMHLTDEKPKCMLEIKGKTILQRQIETLKECGIDDIVVIRGYKKEKINYTGLKYVYNINYRRNNILESLMTAQGEMGCDFIASYSDILYEKPVVEALMKSKADLSVVVDSDWKKGYEGRSQHPLEEAEKVVIKGGKVEKIAKALSAVEAHGEFIGLMRFSKKGAETLKQNYNRLKKEHTIDKPFHTAASLEKAYMTDMFQELINKGYKVSPVMIKGQWTELDTLEDFKKAGGKF